MNIDVNPQASFSLIADFDGDMNELLHTPFDTTLPALILRNMMLFPGVVGSVAINRTMSLKVVNQSLKKGSLIAVLAQKDANVEEPERNDLYDEGVVARVMRTIDLPGLPGSNNCMAILQTYGPIKLEQVKRRKPTMRVEVSPIEEVTYNKDDEEIKALADACRDGMIKFLQLNDAPRSEEAIFAIKNISHPIFLISFICTNMQLSQDERYKLR